MRKASELLDGPYFDGFLGHPDALLIQSAPDLAEACELIVGAEILSKTDDLQGMQMYADGIGKARAALRKARGES